jgi:urease accessory protein
MPKSAPQLTRESTPESMRLLAALQHGDSFFPSGSVSFSWGLESLCAEGLVTDEAEVRQFVEGQLAHRWATCDRPALIATHQAGPDLERVAGIDAEVESLALPQGLRVGSRRAGGALLNAHERLETPQAGEYRQLMKSGAACGHLPVVQGLVWRSTGLSQDEAAAVSGHTLCVGLLGAALRLGVIGHVAGQRILTGLRPDIARLLALPVPPPGDFSAYTPAADIAVMRHETADMRLFAN